MTKQASYLNHIQRAQQQKLSLADYARQHGLSPKRLYAARYTARKSMGEMNSAFVPVQLSTATAIHVVLPNGVTLQIAELTSDIVHVLATLHV